MNDIDVGIAGGGAETTGENRTWVNKDNPANASGVITSVEIRTMLGSLSGCWVGSFYVVSGNTLKCRDSYEIGTVADGTQTIPVHFEIEEGDYIGYGYTAGRGYGYFSGKTGYWRCEGLKFTPGDQATFNSYSGTTAHLYGVGTSAPLAWISPESVYGFCDEVTNMPATKFIDGNLDSAWRTQDGSNHWITVDLGQTRSVKRIRLWRRSVNDDEGWNSFDVSVGDDPESLGTPVATNLDMGDDVDQWIVFAVTDKDGRYVKIHGITTDDSLNWSNGYEIEVEVEELAATALPYAFIM